MATHLHSGPMGQGPNNDGLKDASSTDAHKCTDQTDYWNGNPFPFTTEPVTLPEGAP